MGKRKTKHQKRLYASRVKKEVESRKFKSPPFSLWDFVSTYQMEILLVVFLMGIVFIVPQWNSYWGKKEDVQQQSAISEEMKQQLLARYPNGFQLVEIKNFKVNALDNTLVKSIRANWNDVRLIRMDAEQLKLKVPDIHHDKKHILFESQNIELQRRHQEILRADQLKGIVLLSQILEDNNDRVLCLFSVDLSG